MTNHNPIITSSAANASFSETANTTDSSALHLLSGTMNFIDSDHSDTHTTAAALRTAVWSGGSGIPAATLADLDDAMSSSIVSDSNGSGKLKWSFAAPDDDFDFLAKNETLVLTYDITVSDNHGGTTKQTVKVTITGTDDKPVITLEAVASVNEQADQTLSFAPDTAHIALQFVDPDLDNTGYTASVTGASASGSTDGLLPGFLGTAELMSFFHVDNIVKAAGSSTGTINTTFSAPDLAFDYLAQGESVDITYTVRLDDHAGGINTQNVVVTVFGSNDAPVYISCPESAHLVEDQNVSPSGDLTAHGDLFFADVDLSDTHTVSTTVSASTSGGSPIPLSNADLLAALSTTLEDSSGHLLGEVDWDFALSNASVNFLSGGETLTLTYNVTVADGAGASATQTVTVTVLGTNHPVVMTSDPEAASLAEFADTTGSSTQNSTTPVPTGTLSFTDQDLADIHTVAVSVDSAVWSGGSGIPAATQSDLAAALATTLNDSTGSGSGSIDWTFSIADQDLDFLAAGETLTVNYDVAVHDGSTSASQTVTITIDGANDAPTMTSGPGSDSTAELADTTNSSTLDTGSGGTFNFSDVDLSDTHFVSASLTSATWSANPFFVPADTLSDLFSSLSTTLHDSNGTGLGSIDWSFSIRDADLDFLSAGETLTATYDVTVIDGAASSTQTVTITIDGAADPLNLTPVSAPVMDTAFPDAGLTAASGTIADISHPVDLTSPRTITEVDGSAANVGQPVAGSYGTLYLYADGFYAYVANSAIDPLQVGDNNVTDPFTFTVDDGQGHTATTTLTFDIAGADDNPIITAADHNASLTEDAGPSAIINGGFETGDLTGWSTSGSHIQVQQLELGGAYGHYTAQLAPTGSETLSQNVATTASQHYFVSFTVIGDPEAGSSPLTVTWDGNTLLSLSNVPAGVNQYGFDVVASGSSTPLEFTYADDGTGLVLDAVGVNPATGPATESADGSISFSDIETGDTHTASVTPLSGDYVGTFSLDPVVEGPGSGSVGWHFTVDNSAIQFLGLGQSVSQVYTVSITDNFGASATQDVTITINGTNDAPTAVGETVVTDVGANGTVDIPVWALAANDTDPDMTDAPSPDAIVSSSGGTAGPAVPLGNASFTDDGTLGGSFDYTVSDGHATSSNAATATIDNHATDAPALTGTSGDDILIGNNGGESLDGAGGNDVLIGNAGSHTLTGGAGNDTFAFLQTTDGPNTITDFDNTTDHDTVAISASGFGSGLSPGMDASPVFESSGDDQFLGALFHYDTANQTLYFSSDGTNASAITLAQFQSGVVLHANDLLIV